MVLEKRLQKFHKIATRVIRQRDPKIQRHWYQGEQANLLLDHFRAGRSLAQILLDWENKEGRHPCICWEPEFGSRTGWIDSGEPVQAMHPKGSPLLKLTHEPDPSVLGQGRRLIEASNLEASLKQELLRKLTLIE